ncbi:hypothetical protein ACS0TY_015572 [Phlomoides rotata]
MYLPFHGRSYMWYKPDGSCKSRIDRIMVNNLWVSRWPNLHMKDLRRSVSDHCPLVLEVKVKVCGPKPFRSIDAWINHPEFKDFVGSRCHNYQEQG